MVMRGVITRQLKWSWTARSDRAAAASLLLLLALRLVVMATPIHMASASLPVDAGDVSIMAELPPLCLFGAGDCSVTATPPTDLTLTSASIDIGVTARSSGTMPQLVEAASHGPPRLLHVLPSVWALTA